jgi:LysR family carnitine catabolism transcriptional activator
LFESPSLESIFPSDKSDNPIYQSKNPMKASLEQLQAFLTVAETGHITRAAERLGVSQSTLSATIQRLEELLGAKLFDRSTRGCALSEAGAALHPSLSRLSQDWDRVVADARDWGAIGHGRLSIAAPTAQCALLLPPLVGEICRKLPGLRVTLHDVAEQEVHALVRAGSADVGIATQMHAHGDLVATPFYSDQYILALRHDHPLARRKSVDWARLKDEAVIGPMASNPVRRHLDMRLAETGIALDYRYEVSLPWTMVGLVREGLGVAVLTLALRPLIDWHKLVALPIGRPAIARTLVMLRAQGRPLSPPSQAFRQLLVGTNPGRGSHG